MTIIKNKLIQMFLAGLIFAIISGVFSYLIKNIIFSQNTKYQKQIVVIDLRYKNKIHSHLIQLNETGYLDTSLALSQEYFKSLDYVKTRYKVDNEFNINCYDFTLKLIDDSIFIESYMFRESDQKVMDKCLNKLLDQAFERLIKKIDVYNYNLGSISNIEFEKENSNNLNDEINVDIKKKNNFQISKTICDEIDEVAKEFTLNYGNNNLVDKYGNNDASIFSLFDFHQNLMTVNILEQYCGIINNNKSARKKEFMLKLQEFNEQISKSTFEEIYRVEKKYADIYNKPNKYISTTNIVLTFSIFGFIFGFLLIYNMGSSKKKNE